MQPFSKMGQQESVCMFVHCVMCVIHVFKGKHFQGDYIWFFEVDFCILLLSVKRCLPTFVCISEDVPSWLQSYSIRSHPVKCSRSTDNHITWFLNNFLDFEAIFNEPGSFLIPKSLVLIQIHLEFILQGNSQLLYFFNFHSVPFWLSRSMIDIYCTHWYIFLMPTCPNSLYFHVELWVGTSVDVLLEIGEDVGLSRPSKHGLVDFLSQLSNYRSTLRFEVDTKEDLPSIFEFRCKSLLNFIIFVEYWLIVAVFRYGHGFRVISHFSSLEIVITGVLNSQINLFVSILSSH